jgi:transposase
MARPFHLPDDFKTYDFLSMIDTETNGRKSIRLLAMHHLQLGKSLSAVADIVGVHWKTVQVWVSKFRKLGLPSVGDAPRCGAPRKITGAAEKWLSETIQSLSEAKEGGYITGYELQKLLHEKYGVECSLKTIYNKLHQLNFSWITSRSIHPKTDLEAQEEYKKIPSTAKKVITKPRSSK